MNEYMQIELSNTHGRNLLIVSHDLVGLFEATRLYIKAFGKQRTMPDGQGVLGLHADCDLARLTAKEPTFQYCIHPALNTDRIRALDVAGTLFSQNTNDLEKGALLCEANELYIRATKVNLLMNNIAITASFSGGGFNNGSVNALFEIHSGPMQIEELLNEYATALSLCHEYFCALANRKIGSITFELCDVYADAPTVDYVWPEVGRDVMDQYRRVILEDRLNKGRMSTYDISKLGSQLAVLAAMDSAPLGITDKWLRTSLTPIRNLFNALRPSSGLTDNVVSTESLMKTAEKIGRVDWRIAAQDTIESYRC